jgi:hypothetical protein
MTIAEPRNAAGDFWMGVRRPEAGERAEGVEVADGTPKAGATGRDGGFEPHAPTRRASPAIAAPIRLMAFSS